MKWALIGLLGLVPAYLVIEFIHVAWLLAWSGKLYQGDTYYTLPLEQRRQLKQRLRFHGRMTRPFLWLASRVSPFRLETATFREQGIPGPRGTCSAESFRRAFAYQPEPEDVFVVTQMKCGTTWMQQVVLQVVTRGEADLPGEGRTLYGVSPWLEADYGVPRERAAVWAPDTRPTRIIKTHLPASHCPNASHAHFIYVVRHPVSCFASCADFLRANTGCFAPATEAIRRWFQSDEWMWWTTWPRHVAGWWDRSRAQTNVLFLSFEEMQRDLPSVVSRVAEFLGVEPLNSTEMARIVERCGFQYMKEHADAFEMAPPSLLQNSGTFFVSGRADRHADVDEDTRRQITTWCLAQLRDADFEFERWYGG